MDDLISRQAAISAICNACGKIDCDQVDKCEKLQLSPANISETPNSSDTISRQAAIDALDKRFDSIPMEQTTDILLLRKDLRELPSVQPEPHWIPCSERLPEARQSVILSTENWTGEGCYWETTEYHVIWKGYRWKATYWDDEVIAWRPLPEPYREEEQDD